MISVMFRANILLDLNMIPTAAIIEKEGEGNGEGPRRR